MAIPQFTCLWQVHEPKKHYKPHLTRQATVLSIGNPQLKSNSGCGAWRHVPWINLWGFWLEQAGFSIGTQYNIELYEGSGFLLLR